MAKLHQTCGAPPVEAEGVRSSKSTLQEHLPRDGGIMWSTREVKAGRAGATAHSSTRIFQSRVCGHNGSPSEGSSLVGAPPRDPVGRLCAGRHRAVLEMKPVTKGKVGW